MNYLELVERMADEANVSRPTAVMSQMGEARRFVQHIASAYRDICKRHRNWQFLRSSFTLATVADTPDYLPSDCTDTLSLNGPILTIGFSRWMIDTFRIYRQSDGVVTERRFYGRAYARFRDRWMIGVNAPGFPDCFTERPHDKALLLGATPDAVYVITGDYMRVAPDLVADLDEPLFPLEFHELIVWQALIKYFGFEEDAGGYDHATRERGRLLGDLERDQLPPMALAEALGA